MSTSTTQTINNMNTMHDPFHVNQVKQEQTQMSEQSLYWDTHGDGHFCHGLSNGINNPCPACVQISTVGLLESITEAYCGTQQSHLSPMERFLAPSTEAPNPILEKIGMEQNGMVLGSYGSLPYRTQMVQAGMQKVAATARQVVDVSDTRNVRLGKSKSR